jgi:ABC-2 type transport system permease protein
VTVLVSAAPILAIGTLAIFGYVLECLHAERKDRSILFWKSLPVSDAQTVLSKLAVALAVTPLLIFVLSLLTHLICSAVFGLGMLRGTDVPLWTVGQWLQAYANFAGLMLMNVLWFAPVVVYFMLASVVARRVPLLFATVPLVAVVVAEKLTLDTGYAVRFLANRMRPRFTLDHFASPALWLGVLAAALVLILIVRLRRWRDDS